MKWEAQAHAVLPVLPVLPVLLVLLVPVRFCTAIPHL